MTGYGGSETHGTLYSFNPKTGKDSTLVIFQPTTGLSPISNNLIQAQDSLLYGLINNGGLGPNYYGLLFSFNTKTNKQTVLYEFSGPDGEEPFGDLVQDPDNGLLYGTTLYGGANNMGVLFSYNTITHVETVVPSFDGWDGSYPQREPVLFKDTLHGSFI